MTDTLDSLRQMRAERKAIHKALVKAFWDAPHKDRTLAMSARVDRAKLEWELADLHVTIAEREERQRRLFKGEKVA